MVAVAAVVAVLSSIVEGIDDAAAVSVLFVAVTADVVTMPWKDNSL